MSKWELVGTNDLSFGKFETVLERNKRREKFRKAIRNERKLSYKKLEERTDATFKAKTASDEQLLQAFAEKKLKSKELIQRAKTLKKNKNKESTKTVNTVPSAL
jgi:hypothetical protein